MAAVADAVMIVAATITVAAAVADAAAAAANSSLCKRSNPHTRKGSCGKPTAPFSHMFLQLVLCFVQTKCLRQLIGTRGVSAPAANSLQP